MKMRKIALLIPLCLIVCASTMISGCGTVASTDSVSAYIESLASAGTSGDILVQFTLVDNEDDTSDIEVQFCTIEDYVDNGNDATWSIASMLDSEGGSEADLESVSPGTFSLYWDSDTDLPNANGEYVLRVMPGSDGVDYADIEGPVLVNNTSN